MGAVESKVVPNHGSIAPPASYAQPVAGKQVWFEYLVDICEMVGGIAAVVALVLGLYMCSDKMKRRAAKKEARDEEEAFGMRELQPAPPPEMEQAPGNPAGGHLVDPRDIIGGNDQHAETDGTADGGMHEQATMLPQADESTEGRAVHVDDNPVEPKVDDAGEAGPAIDNNVDVVENQPHGADVTDSI